MPRDDENNIYCPDIEGRDYVTDALRSTFRTTQGKEADKHYRKEAIEESTPRGHQLARGERQAEYGTPTDSFTRIGRIWAALLDLDENIPPEKVAVMLAGMKLSRLVFMPSHEDSQDDVEGYVEALRIVLKEKTTSE